MNGQVRIEQMYAFVLMDDDDTEGIPAYATPSGLWMPMVGADMARVEQLRPAAEELAKAHGKKITLCVFTNREEVEVIGGDDDAHRDAPPV